MPHDAYTSNDTAGGERIVLPGLDANQPIELTPLQELILSHQATIELAYFTLLFATAGVLVYRFVLTPLFLGHHVRE